MVNNYVIREIEITCPRVVDPESVLRVDNRAYRFS